MMEVDHETRKVYVEQMKLIGDNSVQLMDPSEEGVLARLTNPIVTTYIDTDKISFERYNHNSFKIIMMENLFLNFILIIKIENPLSS